MKPDGSRSEGDSATGVSVLNRRSPSGSSWSYSTRRYCLKLSRGRWLNSENTQMSAYFRGNRMSAALTRDVKPFTENAS